MLCVSWSKKSLIRTQKEAEWDDEDDEDAWEPEDCPRNLLDVFLCKKFFRTRYTNTKVDDLKNSLPYQWKKKPRWKVTNFLVVTNIFPWSIILHNKN